MNLSAGVGYSDVEALTTLGIFVADLRLTANDVVKCRKSQAKRRSFALRKTAFCKVLGVRAL